MKPIVRWYKIVFVLAVLLVIGRGVQLVQAAPLAVEDVDALRAEIVALEFGTFDHLRAHNVTAARAETSEDFAAIYADGTRGDLQASLDFVASTEYVFGEPVRGEIEFNVISPEAVLVFYPMQVVITFNGETFTNREYLSSLWQKRDGVWLNTFLQATWIAEGTDAYTALSIANTERAAPPAVAQNATLMDWAENGSPSVVLRAGTNGWICVTDWPVSPGNDPKCYDPELAEVH